MTSSVRWFQAEISYRERGHNRSQVIGAIEPLVAQFHGDHYSSDLTGRRTPTPSTGVIFYCFPGIAKAASFKKRIRQIKKNSADARLKPVQGIRLTKLSEPKAGLDSYFSTELTGAENDVLRNLGLKVPVNAGDYF